MEKKQQDRYQGIVVSDIVQMCCLNMLTGICSIREDSFKGQIYLEKGEIIHAYADGLRGEEAFYHILRHPYADIDFKEGPIHIEKSISSHWQHLLLEGSRQQDHDMAGNAGGVFLVPQPEPSLVHLKVQRVPFPQSLVKKETPRRSRKAGVIGIIKKSDVSEECVIDTISDEEATLRTLGSFEVGDRVRIIFKLPPRQEEANVLADISSISADTISITVRFFNPDDQAKKLIGFFLWNS